MVNESEERKWDRARGNEIKTTNQTKPTETTDVMSHNKTEREREEAERKREERWW